MASSLSLCLRLARQGQRSPRELGFTVVWAPRSPRELGFTVVWAPSEEELPTAGDGLATHPSASAVPCSYHCVWHLPSSQGRIWGELLPQKPWVPSPGSGTARSHAGAGTAPAAPSHGAPATPVSHPAGPSPPVDPQALGPLCFRQVHSALCEVSAFLRAGAV